MSERAAWSEHDSASRTSSSQARATTTDSPGKPAASSSTRKRRAPGTGQASMSQQMSVPLSSAASAADEEPSMTGSFMALPPAKKSRTNTPWTPADEQKLKTMRDAGNSWAAIAKDMHYAEFAEDESQALLNAIKEYEMNKWKEIGKKVGKPAKVG
ncbi:hypothetical protein QTJ16_002567 [Diplocarpon rosae]|uniref:Myb-like domain-containing protein n=1 Tax=Diplocarpon rosae TaxID=946125 RepID=A0AAD9T1Z8_9HELO|nr:hypothetical protein QTJ16_002567 [Diplocarpon rosae]